MYVPLHVYSDFSFGWSAASLEGLAQRAQALAVSSIALTDIESMAGQIAFHHECKRKNIKAISGLELRDGFQKDLPFGSNAGRLVLLARNRDGYELLCRIVSSRQTTGRGSGTAPNTVLPLIANASEYLFALTDTQELALEILKTGFAPHSLKMLLSIDRVVDEDETLRTFARSHNLKLLADSNIVMLEKTDRPVRNLLLAIHLGVTVNELSSRTDIDGNAFLSPAEFTDLFSKYEEAIQESRLIAEACALDLTESTLTFPSVELPKGESAMEHLTRRCVQALEGFDSTYIQRLRDELIIIEERKLAPYFLTVAEIANAAHSMRIAMTARGSAVGSLVTFALGISNIDPIAHGLLFERFLNRHRNDLPDIDLDFESSRRDEVIDWVFKRYGRKRTAMVCMYTNWQRRSAYREGLKALGMKISEVNDFVQKIPIEDFAQGKTEEFDDIPDSVAQPLLTLSEPYRSFAPLIEQILGKPRHLSIHPGGVVIADRELSSIVPLEKAAKGITITQFDLRSVALAGLVKIDLLGNRGLSEMSESGHLDDVTDGDPETWTAIDSAETIGCFQIETPTMRSILKRMPIRGMGDLVAALAIARPGPSSSAAKSAFLKRARGEEAPTPLHPAFYDCLAETYGIPLYDEQIIQMISILTGLSLSEADRIRENLIDYHESPVLLEQLKKEFVDRSLSHNVNLEAAARPDKSIEADIEKVWKNVTRFASYSFNKAHASSYAVLAYKCTFLKIHFPTELACSILNNYMGAYPLRTIVAEFQRDGVQIMIPHVNISREHAIIEDGGVRVGLNAIKFLSKKVLKAILTERELRGRFTGLADFLKRVPLSLRELESLILSGACDDLHPLTTADYPFGQEAVIRLFGKTIAPQSLANFAMPIPLVSNTQEAEKLTIYKGLARVRNELNFLDMNITNHPIAILRKESEKYHCVEINKLQSRIDQTVQIVCLIAATHRVMTGAGIVQFLTFEDETGLIEGTVNPTVYRKMPNPIDNPGPFIVEGKLVEDSSELKIQVKTLTPFYRRDQPGS